MCCIFYRYDYINQIEDLFKPHQESAAPNRVILQGEPGIGKSTMCQKIAFDWSKSSIDPITNERRPSVDRSLPKYLEQYKMLFYLRARDMKESLSDSIYDHILPEDFPVSKDDFQKYVEQHQRETLFIIDGFDEINKEGMNVVQKLVQRRILPHSTVLLTSRSQYAIHLLKYFDSLFVVNGYSQERIVDFIKKYSTDMRVPIETFDSLLEQIKKSSTMKEICRNPLNLCFLCILCEERNGILPDTRTEIYDEIVSMLLQKASERLDLPIEKLEWHLQQLCELAFRGIQRNVFSFPAHEFTCEKVLASMGFLNKEVPISRLKSPTAYYVFTHTSFQEYLGARHVSSLPKSERKAFLFKNLRSRHLSVMWGFFCGVNRTNESVLLEYFTAFEEQYCPMIADCSWAMDHKRLLHMPRNIPFHRLSVQDITSGLHIQCLRCLKEIDIKSLSAGARELIAKCIPHQISFSHIYISRTALVGLLSYLKVAKTSEMYQLVVSGQVFYDHEQNNRIFALFKDIAKTGQVASVGLHMVTNTSQLKIAFHTFDLDKSYSTIKSLKLKFMSFVDFTPEEIEELKFGRGLESLEIYDCNNPRLLSRLLEQSSLNSTDLTKVVLRNCILDGNTLAKLTTLVKSKRFDEIDFTENHIQNDSELITLPFLAALEAREPSLKLLWLSGLPSRQSWQPDSTYCSHATKYLKTILLNNKLEHLHLSQTVLHKSSLEILVSLVQQGKLKSVEIEFCFIICVDTFNLFLKALGNLPELTHISVKGSTIRSIEEKNVLLSPDVVGLTSTMAQLSPRSDLEDPPNLRFERMLPELGSQSPPRYTMDLIPRPAVFMEQLSPKPRSDGPSSPRSRKLLAARRDHSPPCFKFSRETFARAISVPEGMQDKVIMSNINNARVDDRSKSIHILHGLLEKTLSLRSLALSDLYTDQLICLCKGLEKNTTLVSLALLYSNFTEACTAALCQFLEKHPCIQEFSLARSNMNSIEAESFFESVAKCKPLQTLGLTHCLFHDKHMKLLANSVSRNLSIFNVLLRDNSRVTSDGAQVLYNGLKARANQLRILDLSDCRITRDDDIVEQLKEVSLVVKVNWF